MFEKSPSFGLAQVKQDFENAKKRALLAHTMNLQGFSKAEIKKAIDEISEPDMVDLLAQEIK